MCHEPKAFRYEKCVKYQNKNREMNKIEEIAPNNPNTEIEFVVFK